MQTYMHTYLYIFSMLWHRQAIFDSKGDKLSSSAEYGIRTQGLWNRISSRLNTRWQTDWAIEDQAKNLMSIARPYDQPAFSPLDPHAYMHACIHIHMHTHIYIYIRTNTFALHGHAKPSLLKEYTVYFFLAMCKSSIISSNKISFTDNDITSNTC